MELKIDPKIIKERELEKLYNKNQTYHRILQEFINSEVNFTKYMTDNQFNPEFGFDLLVQMVLHKRANLSTLVGILRKHFVQEANPSQACVEMLVKAAEIDLVDWSSVDNVFIIKFDITEDVQRDLDMYQYPLPMIAKPLHLSKNTSSPYYALPDGSLILKNNHHNDDICLDHLNRVNQVEYTINNQVALMIQNHWANLDKPKMGETKQSYQRRVKAFQKYDRTARDVMDQITELGNEFYLTHKYDKRGRTYCQGYHINYMGNAWNKAVVELSNKEIIP